LKKIQNLTELTMLVNAEYVRNNAREMLSFKEEK
jgi:hypothetical protein